MPRVRKLEAFKELVVSSYQFGSSMEMIASAHNVSPGTVRNILIRQGVPLRKQGRKRKEDNAN